MRTEWGVDDKRCELPQTWFLLKIIQDRGPWLLLGWMFWNRKSALWHSLDIVPKPIMLWCQIIADGLLSLTRSTNTLLSFCSFRQGAAFQINTVIGLGIAVVFGPTIFCATSLWNLWLPLTSLVANKAFIWTCGNMSMECVLSVLSVLKQLWIRTLIPYVPVLVQNNACIHWWSENVNIFGQLIVYN